MIQAFCDKCGDEIEGFAGIAHSPPLSPHIRPHITIKYHLCQKCWDIFKKWIATPKQKEIANG